MNLYRSQLKTSVFTVLYYVAAGLAVGLVAGLVGVAFSFVLHHCKHIFAEHGWLLYLLPLGGLVIAWLYKAVAKGAVQGTDMVVLGIRDNKDVPWLTAPLIFVSTALTHLFGGSSGREGAALQLGGSIGSFCGRFVKHETVSRPILVMCGMAAVFSALFGTPVAAGLFVLEVVSVGVMNYAALLPCMIASFTGYLLAEGFGLGEEHLVVSMPKLALVPALQTIVLGLACALVSILFIKVLHWIHHGLEHGIKNEYLRIVLGGGAIILLTLLVGSTAYNGTGMALVERAVEGQANWYDFLLKMLFTAITLGAGYKGGEIVPALCIGATFGCFAGGILGMDPGMAAALGAVSVFCGVTNSPVASVFIGAELFGGGGILYYAIACTLAYTFSGNHSLYHEQRILYSKVDPGKM